jgi:hypothetical protein
MAKRKYDTAYQMGELKVAEEVKRLMMEKILLAGFGGQGVML